MNEFKSDCRLLDPKMESSGSFFVGSFILQLILHLSSQMAQHLPDLVAALVRRMQSVQIAGVRSSLILIFARLVIFPRLLKKNLVSFWIFFSFHTFLIIS